MGFPGRPPEQCALAFVPLFSFYSVYGKNRIWMGWLTPASQVPRSPMRWIGCPSHLTLSSICNPSPSSEDVAAGSECVPYV